MGEEHHRQAVSNDAATVRIAAFAGGLGERVQRRRRQIVDTQTLNAAIEALDVHMHWTEEERVVAWRIEGLLCAGFDEHAAIELAERRDVDLHVAKYLLERGCSIETALRILL